MIKGFWKYLEKPIVALSPMDGVTDAAFRYIVDKHGKPNILFTEFTSAEGLERGAVALLNAFIYHKTETPTVAQIFGARPQSFYTAAFIISELGFDGIDINMGCPDKNVSRHGGGAGLILDPLRAQKIIKQTKQGVKDWSQGETIENIGLHKDIVAWIKDYQQAHHISPQRKELPVSVKTRIGYDKIVTLDWIKYLLEMEPVNISVHGRTLRQMYTGYADWEEIGKAAETIKKTETTVLGNGDIHSLEEAKDKVQKYNLEGVLIGRASFGNPWVFQEKQPTLEHKMSVAIEHAYAFESLTPQLHFLSLRKHMAWYCKGFPNATDLRMALVHANSAKEIEQIITSATYTNKAPLNA